ncbi:MAG: hypothetical protein PHO10_11735, partial [Gemmiger sp.]|nr:hypothetical protein [Gemmiger sp.]
MTDFTAGLAKAADGYPAIGFDVFGTLLLRDLAKPTDLFAWMEQSGAAPRGFMPLRVGAEKKARAAHPHAEVTLAEIYGEMPPSVGRAGLASKECAAELQAGTANLPLLALCKALRAAGKRLYAISDIYLPAAQLQAMLHRCGYPEFDGVYASSEYGVQKRSGKLFALVLKKEGLLPRQLL